MSVLEDHEDAVGVVEPAIESQNVWVSETGLNLHLSLKLVVDPVVFYLLLEYHLQCHYEFTLSPK